MEDLPNSDFISTSKLDSLKRKGAEPKMKQRTHFTFLSASAYSKLKKKIKNLRISGYICVYSHIPWIRPWLSLTLILFHYALLIICRMWNLAFRGSTNQHLSSQKRSSQPLHTLKKIFLQDISLKFVMHFHTRQPYACEQFFSEPAILIRPIFLHNNLHSKFFTSTSK